jgi:hypothetical protein
MLDAHPRIHCGPEVTFMRDFYRDYLEDPLDHLRFSTTARSILEEEELFDVLGDAFIEVHERAAARAGKSRWADKAPENVLYLDRWQRLLGDEWYVVHVVRNPLDTLASMEGRFPLTLPPDLDRKIDFYRRYVESGLTFGERHPTRYRVLVYEALCAEPGDTLGELMAWLGESLDSRQLAFNDVPHQPGLEDASVAATQEVHTRSLGRWSSVLSEEAANHIWSRTRDLWARIDPEGRYESPPDR